MKQPCWRAPEYDRWLRIGAVEERDAELFLGFPALASRLGRLGADRDPRFNLFKNCPADF